VNTRRCLEYRGYLGSVQIDPEARIFHGRIEFIEDLVTFEGNSYTSLEQEFKAAVEDYLRTCKTANRSPDVPFKGTFNVRIGAELHKQAAITAKRCRKSLNEFVKESIAQHLTRVQRVDSDDSVMSTDTPLRPIKPTLACVAEAGSMYQTKNSARQRARARA